MTFTDSSFPISSIDFPKAEQYLLDLITIKMADSGRVDVMYTNGFFDEATQMIANAIRLFQRGYFDCAFYSLRQSLELSIGIIYINAEPERLKEWNALKGGFEDGRMVAELQKKEPAFSEIRCVLSDYFEHLSQTKRKINKYIHKQGYNSFYLSDRLYNQAQKNKRKSILVKTFENALKDCIGAVALYRLVIDPLPAVLMDEDILQRSGDFITEPYSQSFIERYIGKDVFEQFCKTSVYQSLHDELSKWELQNEAMFDLIHFQFVDRKQHNAIVEQIHLCGIYDRIGFLLFLCSPKISQVFLMNGFLWYSSDVKSVRTSSGITMGTDYYQKFFDNGSEDYNVSYENVFLSRCKIHEEWEFIEHNERLNDCEIAMIRVVTETVTDYWQATEEKLKDTLKTIEKRDSL